jgi:hypothetical protein
VAFVYPSGDRQLWAYRNGKVLWNQKERVESFVGQHAVTADSPEAACPWYVAY